MSDQIKEAFKKVKEDMDFLFNEIQELKRTLSNLNITTNNSIKTDRQTQTFDTSTDISTDNLPLEAVKSPNSNISTGNKGVSTDRQTHRQTDRHDLNELSNTNASSERNLNNVSNILHSLDSIRSEVIDIFKNLTQKEMLVFSTIYQLEETQNTVDYRLLATKLNITESSVRDHVLRAIRKNAPIQKIKLNNKKIVLSISPELKKIAPLSTIISIQESKQQY